MAIQVASTADTVWGADFVCLISKPSGLAVGDLMVAQIATEKGSGISTPPSGWTLLRTTVASFGNDIASYLYYKVADSSDVAASDFQWSYDGSNSYLGTGIIYRITGYDAITQDNGGTDDNASNPQSYAIGITPTAENSLLITFFGVVNGAVTLSSNSIATDNPSWTQGYQYNTTSGNDYTAGSFYAVRPQNSATGNVSISGLAIDDDSLAQIIAISPSTVSPGAFFQLF